VSSFVWCAPKKKHWKPSILIQRVFYAIKLSTTRIRLSNFQRCNVVY